MRFQAISMKEVEKYMAKPGTQLIDLRSREEYDLYHIEGSKNMPYDDMGKYKKYLSRDITYILYCERGSSSLMAAKELSQEGYQVCTVIGGIRAWEERYLN